MNPPIKKWLQRFWKWLAGIGALLVGLATLEPWLTSKFPGLWSWIAAVWSDWSSWLAGPISIPRIAVLFGSLAALGMTIAFLAKVHRKPAAKAIDAQALELHELYVMSALALRDGQPITSSEVAQHRRIRKLEVDAAIDSLISRSLITSPLVAAGEMRYFLSSEGRKMAISYQIENAIAAKLHTGGTRKK